MEVSFLGRLVAGNRLQVPVEIRWRFRLRPGEICLVRLEFEEWGSAEFYARLQRGGQVMVPVEVVRAAELERGKVMEVFMHVGDEYLLLAIRMASGLKFYPHTPVILYTSREK